MLPPTVTETKKGVAVKRKKTGLTLVELLVVLGIIALLVGVLIPALTAVKNMAKETKQKAQLTTISLALTAFRSDYGNYPPSAGWYYNPTPGGPLDYCGAQKLAEALLGWDMLGFHPASVWRADGLDAASGPGTYDPPKTRDVNNDGVPDTLSERKGPYLELATTNVFRLGVTAQHDGLFDFGLVNSPLAPAADTFVICDVFGKKKVVLANGKNVRAGAPILYYRANTSVKTIDTIYDVRDNDALVVAKEQADDREHPLARPANQFQFFYDYIRDPRIDARPWPYRPDSYILISAGADGLYGTSDDICNFGN